MKVADHVQNLINQYPAEAGYIVAWNTAHPGSQPPPDLHSRFMVSFLKRHSRMPDVLIGGHLEDALVFPTYQAAADACDGIRYPRKTQMRILRIERRAPMVLFEDLPATLLDVLAEV